MNRKNQTLWISHSAISSFSRCPHSYYLQYIYRNPNTGNRVQINNPYFSLGLAVHRTIEELSSVSIKERTKISLKDRFDDIFAEYRGIAGGFISSVKEKSFYERGLQMMERVEKSSFLHRPSVNTDTDFPTIDLFKDNVKLVGSLDWIELLPQGTVHIVDFKTGNSKESNGSLQLPIYKLLAENNLSQKVESVSYWYLQHDDEPISQEIKEDFSLDIIKEKAAEIKRAIEEENFPCQYPGRCFACEDYEKIFQGEAEMVSEGGRGGKDSFCVFKEKEVIEKVMEESFLDEREKKVFEMRMKKPLKEINQELRLSEKKSALIVQEVKEKLAKNLRPKELKIIIKALQK